MIENANDFCRAVEAALLMFDSPPQITKVELEQYSWYGAVEASDGPIIWRFVCERSVLRLEAAPVHSSNDFFDADLLRREVSGRGYDLKRGYPDNRLAEASLSVLIEQIRELRPGVASAFNKDRWIHTRQRLVRLGHLRDNELFGHPIPEERR